MYTFLSLTAEKFQSGIDAGTTTIKSDDRRLVMYRDGIVYKPNYFTMEHIASFYYQEQKISDNTLLTFVAIRKETDYVTDVNGKQVLKNTSVHCGTLSHYPLITIESLRFIGTPSQLLKKHGLIYYLKGVNTLKLEKEMVRRARQQLALAA